MLLACIWSDSITMLSGKKKKNFLNAFRSSFNCSFRKVVGCLDKICIKNFSIWSTWKKVQSLNVEVGISLCIRFLFLFVPCYLVILFLNIWRDKCNQVNFIVTCKNVKMHLFVPVCHIWSNVPCALVGCLKQAFYAEAGSMANQYLQECYWAILFYCYFS